MELTRKSDYACRILRAIFRADGKCISVKAIAEEEDIPYSFARLIQRELALKGLIGSKQGTGGGIYLAVDPKEVTVLEVIKALQGNDTLMVSPCVAHPESCKKSGHCDFHMLWQGAANFLESYYGSVTLYDLLTKGKDHPTIVAALKS